MQVCANTNYLSAFRADVIPNVAGENGVGTAKAHASAKMELPATISPEPVSVPLGLWEQRKDEY